MKLGLQISTNPPTIEKWVFNSKDHLTDAARISEIKWTMEEFSWKQEVNAEVSNTHVKHLHEILVEPQSWELERTVPSAVYINYLKAFELDYKDKSSSKAWDYSMLGTVGSEDPKGSLLPKFQGIQQEHDLGASTGGFLRAQLEKNYKDQNGVSFSCGIRSHPAQRELHGG